MRKIENKTFNFQKVVFQQDSSTTPPSVVEVRRSTSMTYFEVLIDAMNIPPSNGFTSGQGIAEMVKRIAVQEKLEAKPEVGATVLLEDSQYEDMMKAFRTYPWGVVSKEVVACDQYLNSIPREEA